MTGTPNLLQKSKKDAAASEAEPAVTDATAPVVVPAVVVAPDVVVVPAASMEAAAISQSAEANGSSNANGEAQPVKIERTDSGKAML